MLNAIQSAVPCASNTENRAHAGAAPAAVTFADALARLSGKESLPQPGPTDSADAESAARAVSTQAAETGSTQGAQCISLEEMLKVRYPGLHYHVFDASSSHWKTRNDYPHYLLYQDGDAAQNTLPGWQPQGDNPFYGSVNGQFIAPKEIKALGSIPPGSKAVVIHPDVQARMEQDPAYAQEIYSRIEAWFAFDTARNEAAMPGSTWDNAQAVAIGADGNICNACTSSPGQVTYSESPSGRTVSPWDARLARHAAYMKWVTEQQIEHGLSVSQYMQASAAKLRLAEMIQHGGLQEILGATIGGLPTETILNLALDEIGSGLRL